VTLKEIRNLVGAGGHISIEVHAVDLAIYQVFQRFSGRLTPVTDKNKSVRFPSRYAALKALAELGLDEVEFVHRSAYGEMIGTESPFGETELRQRVRIAHLRD
jgi:hypothetical protein